MHHWNNIFFAERMDFAISGTLARVSEYSSRVARSRLKPGARGLTFLSCTDHSCRRKEQRWLGRTKAWKKLRDLEGNCNTKQPAGNPLPFRAEGEPQWVGWFTLYSETADFTISMQHWTVGQLSITVSLNGRISSNTHKITNILQKLKEGKGSFTIR